MIAATFTDGVVLTAAADPADPRTISGVAVPWGVEGRVSSGERVIFEAGSLDPAARPVALRDHDRTRPIGRVAAAADRGEHLDATVRVSAHPDGNEALLLAADGVLAAFSVGVEPTAWHHDPDGVLHVTAADWQELSLLTIGAYPTAQVHTVTATTPGDPMLTATTPTDPDDPTEPDDPAEPVEPVEAIAAAAAVPLAPVRRSTASTRDRYAGVGISQLAELIAAAQMDATAADHVRRVFAAAGPIGRGAGIEAALSNVTLVGTDNVGAAHRPAYQAELVDIVSHGSPLVDALSQGDLQRGDYPNKTYNRWTKTPQVAEQTAEKTDIASGPVSIGVASAPVKTWATGNDVSQATLDLGSPSFVDDYIRAAGLDYATTIDTYAATTLLAAATPATTTLGMSFADIAGAMFAALDPTKVPPGQMWMAASWDQAVTLMGVTRDQGPAFWDGSVSWGGFIPTANMGGLSVFVDPNLPASTWLLGMSQAATWYDLPGTPFSLRAVDVGRLGLDVAVYGYGALAVKYPDAFVKTTIPPVTGRSGSRS